MTDELSLVATEDRADGRFEIASELSCGPRADVAGCRFVLRAAEIPKAPDYDRDIRPILRSRCVTCHGPIKQEGGLRLDAGKLVLQGGDSGAVVKPAKSGESPLLARVSTTNLDERMPPKGAPLAEQEIAVLKAWIDAGAPVPAGETIAPRPEEHWSFQPIRPVPAPEVQDREWPRNPIDQFVLSKLEAQSWRPNPDASKAALLRRVYLDLIGLPPTIAEQDAYLANTDPKATNSWSTVCSIGRSTGSATPGIGSM